jgi:general secretion pathway protein E
MTLLSIRTPEADVAQRAEPNRGGGEFSGVAVVSRSGVFEASSEEKKLLCLLGDGRLLVAEGQSLNPHVSARAVVPGPPGKDAPTVPGGVHQD